MGKKRRKRGNGEGGIEPQAGGRWKAVANYTDLDGRRRRLTRTCRTHRAAVEALAALQERAGVLASAPPPEAPPTLAEHYETWLRVSGHRYAQSTLDVYKPTAKAHLLPHLGGVRVDQLTGATIEEWLATLSRDAVGPAAVETSWKVLKRVLKHAKARGIVEADPTGDVPPPRYEAPEVDPFTADEVKAILEAAKGDRLGLAGRVAFATGMRSSELFGLTWPDVDVSAGVLIVRRQIDTRNGRCELKTPKSRAGVRSIPIGPEIQEAVEKHRRRSRKNDLDLVFTAPEGGPVRGENFRNRSWYKWQKKAEVRRRHLHCARHTYATHLLRSGISINAVSRLLGHADPAVTLRIYGHYISADAAAAVTAVATLVG